MKIVMGLLVVVILIVGLVFSLPFLIDLNKYQDQYKPLIEDALNRKIQLQDIRLTVWPRIGARVAGFAVLGLRVWSLRVACFIGCGCEADAAAQQQG
ncbi:MAG: hypothetical protein HP491_04855 [Nitrospira sp.]|nr:hypothetical protein [Nitrospira sp.]